jgi:hypothetical protein
MGSLVAVDSILCGRWAKPQVILHLMVLCVSFSDLQGETWHPRKTKEQP